MQMNEWDRINLLTAELVETQRKDLLKMGRRFVPTLTPEDILQPNDYPILENNPHFRYEEGILAGLQTMQMAIQALHHETIDSFV